MEKLQNELLLHIATKVKYFVTYLVISLIVYEAMVHLLLSFTEFFNEYFYTPLSKRMDCPLWSFKVSECRL